MRSGASVFLLSGCSYSWSPQHRADPPISEYARFGASQEALRHSDRGCEMAVNRGRMGSSIGSEIAMLHVFFACIAVLQGYVATDYLKSFAIPRIIL